MICGHSSSVFKYGLCEGTIIHVTSLPIVKTHLRTAQSYTLCAGVDNTEDNRRDWRELLYTAPDLGKYISGAIMFEETLYQSCADGRPFVHVLRNQGIMPGIKVDAGLEACPHLQSLFSAICTRCPY